MSDPAGALLFARYAYPPNALGLCGADSPGTLLEYGDAGESDGGLAELARTFEGAWPYLTLIAEANRIEDPLDPRVVEAYWVGDDRGDPLCGAVPHHCFHVFALYPWLGLLRSGITDEPLRVLDQCRTTPALVLGVEGEAADVLAEPLLWDDGKLRLGKPEQRRVRWRDAGRAFARPQAGELVSLHWDFVCDVLSPSAARGLDQATRRAIRAVNRP